MPFLQSHRHLHCRDEAEGLFACLDASSESVTPRASQTGQAGSVGGRETAASSPGALDDSNFPSLCKETGPPKVPPTLHMATGKVVMLRRLLDF